MGRRHRQVCSTLEPRVPVTGFGWVECQFLWDRRVCRQLVARGLLGRQVGVVHECRVLAVRRPLRACVEQLSP
jgi:hypothetical protein